MDIRQALATACAAQGLDRLDAQLLLLHALGRPQTDRAWLLAHDTDALEADAHRRYADLTGRRAAGVPLAYLTGQREFYGLMLQVDPRVLDPRPDTETLVDWALERLPPQGSVIDLGTGSGAIALAIQSQRPDARVIAIDASADALAVAQANAQRLRLAVRFEQHDWLSGVQGRFDLIVSNPPYIAEGDPHLDKLGHEPSMALSSGADGLNAIRTLIAQAPAHLQADGWLLLEHGWDQATTVRALLAQAGFTQVQSRADLAGIERCSGGQAPPRN
ncbi:MAG: peptide chain release factor N(5)-glutamine methyltransferase [Hylemonella sp.]|nr:peptide chain release factor N(5)-glutamine methyltransferase [Hylemonella sp.]